MNTKPVMPAEAKALWHSLEATSAGQVAARVTAAGRAVSRATIGRWKRAGWARASVEGVATAVAAAVATMDSAAPALTGDLRSTLADIVAARPAGANAEQKPAPPDN